MSGRNEIVYVVNDNPETRATICCYLEGAGLDTRACGSAAECLNESAATPPCCAILDIELPDMSGLDLQLELAALGVPIVFVTAYSEVTAIVRALKAGAVDLLQPPLSRDNVLVAVNAALDQYRRRRHAQVTLVEVRNRRARLTPRERQVMRLLVNGMMNKQIALDLGISEVTVQIHRGRIMDKMRARSFAHLVRMAQTLESSLDWEEFS
ncbi:response regulator transcription factor [Steroidobacter agaridevorans]|nr:LuxR C-terminal-related transcriptional regulator [Steroidobacter agaridevorans]